MLFFNKIITTIPILKRLYPSILSSILILIKKDIFIIKFKKIYIKINIRDPIDKEIFFRNSYEEEQVQFLIDNIKDYKKPIFIDIGANKGIYSLLLAKEFEKLKIYSFEPVTQTFNCFVDNIYLNNLKKNIKKFDFGISNTTGNKKMIALKRKNYIQSGGYSFQIKEKKIHKDNIVEYYKTKIGDRIIKFKKKILFIKIDVEGYEEKVLKGLNKLMSSNKIFIQIEIFNKNLNLIDTLLKKNNFYLIRKIEHKHSGSDYFYKNF
jgi:FkbM family methyltransferase